MDHCVNSTAASGECAATGSQKSRTTWIADREGVLPYDCLWIAALNQVGQSLPGHNLIHFGQELLELSELLRRELIAIGGNQLLIAH
jgi:hypothetical protein